MGTLQAALSWAQRGFLVFPLRENTREPALSGDWSDVATSDPASIIRLWTDPVLRTERNYNVGCVTTGMVVIDIDVKNGKDGYNEYIQMGGTFDTLIVRTTSGGYHCYYHGPNSSNAGISSAVDIRSNKGYVVAPGSIIDGAPYEVIHDVPMTSIPAVIEQRLKPAYQRAEVDAILPTDTPAAIEQGRRFLESCPVAVQGNRGDETTFTTAARMVREMALSAPTVFCLMRDYWNENCSPPWDLSELLTKIENAAAYGTAEFGCLSTEVLFGHVRVQPPPSLFEQGDTAFGNGVVPERIQPRPWLVDRALMHRAVTILMAAGSAGKSTVSLALAAHLAIGKDFAGYKTLRACKSIIYNGEDDLEEQSRRLIAVCMAYGFDYNEVKKNIMLLSSRQIKLELVTKQFNHAVRNDLVVQHITDKCSDPEVGLLVLDPFVNIHSCDESDNVQMAFVMNVLNDIAYDANIAVMALHHTTKGGGQEQRIGNMDIGRGASSIINAARIGFTLLSASNQDAQDYGFQDEERHLWVRLDDAKMNLALANQTATWFRKEAVRIPSMDFVGVLRHTKLEKSRNHMRVIVADALIASMTATGKGSLSLPEAVAVVRGGVPHWASMKDGDIKKKLEEMYIHETDIKGHKIQSLRDDAGKIVVVLR